MAQHSFNSHPLLRLFLQQVLYKRDSTGRKLRRKIKILGVNAHYLLHRLFTANVVKRSLADQQLVSQHAQTPQIHTHIVLIAL